MIGGPGSGKGTQSLKIAERYGFQYISVGELLRKKIHSASSNRKWSLIAKIITTGELAPQVLLYNLLLFCKDFYTICECKFNCGFSSFFLKKETTITEIKQKLMQMPEELGIVIDGFPRDVAQALSFEDQVRMSPYLLNDLFFFFLLKYLRLKIYIYISWKTCSYLE